MFFVPQYVPQVMLIPIDQCWLLLLFIPDFCHFHQLLSYIMTTNVIRVRVMVFNSTFNNISVISWQSILLMEETGVPGEKHQTVAGH